MPKREVTVKDLKVGDVILLPYDRELRVVSLSPIGPRTQYCKVRVRNDFEGTEYNVRQEIDKPVIVRRHSARRT